jgi:hypothetical protein
MKVDLWDQHSHSEVIGTSNDNGLLGINISAFELV